MYQPKIENMRNFTAPYVYNEYPKHITLADGSFIVVHNADEEAAARGDDEGESGEHNERAELLSQARALGLNPHHKLGAEKLRELIHSHQQV